MPASRAVGKRCYEVFHADICETGCMLERTLHTGQEMIDQPVSIVNADGDRVPISISTAVLRDDDGNVLDGNGVSGNLCLARSWPGHARTIFGDHGRFKDTYFGRFSGRYFTGDGCRRDEDGYYWITGRVDDVLNVSGHRIGTAEIESALVTHEAVAEAAVVGYPHEIKGTGIHAFAIVNGEFEKWDPDELVGALKETVRHEIGHHLGLSEEDLDRLGLA